MKKKISDILSIILMFVLIYAASSKFITYSTFVAQVKQSPMLTKLGNTVPWLVLAVEILVGILLIIETTRLFALYCSFSMMIIFTTYIFIILNFMDNIPCSCGGIIEKLDWNKHLVFNLVLMVLNILAIYLYAPSKSKKISYNSI